MLEKLAWTTTIGHRWKCAVFRALLEVAARHRLPVVIHCRGYGSSEADKDCLDILREVLPSYPIHFHCFSAPIEHFKLLSSSFPNSIFGLTKKFPSSSWLSELLSLLSLRRVVFESDAPFLSPSPFHLHPIAVSIANEVDCHPHQVLMATAFTALCFYSHCTPSTM